MSIKSCLEYIGHVKRQIQRLQYSFCSLRIRVQEESFVRIELQTETRNTILSHQNGMLQIHETKRKDSKPNQSKWNAPNTKLNVKILNQIKSINELDEWLSLETLG